MSEVRAASPQFTWNEYDLPPDIKGYRKTKRHHLVVNGDEQQRFYVVGPLEDDDYYRFYYDSHVFIAMFYISNFLRMNHVRGGSLDAVKAKVERKYATFHNGEPSR